MRKVGNPVLDLGSVEPSQLDQIPRGVGTRSAAQVVTVHSR